MRGGEAVLSLEWLDLRSDGDYAALARMLARVHRHTGPRFGWERDNWIGLGPQRNGWSTDWPAFFEDKRLAPQLELARRKGYSFSIPDVKALLAHRPEPSLLHGDLWRGNAGFVAQGPVLFDPAVYYGDREADLAMTELFGGFPPAFYASYREEWPLEPGYEERKHLYNLYHLLNHLNLFGPGYLGQVEASLRLLRKAL